MPGQNAAADREARPDGRFLDNIVHFGRALRLAGLKIGPGQLADAARAVEASGFSSKADLYWILHACLVTRREHRQVFDQIFRLFWRDPRYHEHMMSLLLPMVRGADKERKADSAARRAAESLLAGAGNRPEQDRAADPEDAEIKLNAAGTSSARERLQTLDFEQMTNEEMAEARRLIANFKLPVKPLLTRRKVMDRRGRHPEWRATMRRASRQGGEIRELLKRSPRTRWPNLIAICDISGSMSVYSRVLLRFLHAVSGSKGDGWAKVFAFTFGTRLTNVTRQLRVGDPDSALSAVGSEARDWDGGTLIGDCIRAFNRDWSRRVMGQGSIVLLISDGLDSGNPDLLEREIVRLRLSARRLIWINPLLRWEGFEPRAAGVAAMLPHVDCFKSAHNLDSLAALGRTISDARDDGEKSRLITML